MHALILDDDKASRDVLSLLVEEQGFCVSTAGSIAEARASIKSREPDVAILDLQLPDGVGLDLIEELRTGRDPEVIVLTGHSSVDTALRAMKTGARDYLEKPIRVDAFRELLRGVSTRRQRFATGSRGAHAEQGSSLVGDSSEMRRLRDLISRVAPTEASVLIAGSTGTGKELIAREIHLQSKRSAGPFEAINCGALSASLVESQLFGHEKGAFTGAIRRHRGFFEVAAGGTLFLDEISEMPIEMQVNLLRVLENREFSRVGAEETRPVDVRIVAATNRDPIDAVEAGLMREDLYYRLCTFRLDAPPLKHRLTDIPMLASHLLRLDASGDAVSEITPAALAKLADHDWPGNVRELRNVLSRAAILGGKTIRPEHVDLSTCRRVLESNAEVVAPVGSTIRDVERQLIEATLDALDGDKRAAADRLGISLKTLYNRLNVYAGG